MKDLSGEQLPVCVSNNNLDKPKVIIRQLHEFMGIILFRMELLVLKEDLSGGREK